MLKPVVQFFLEEFAVLSLGFCFWWLLLEVATAPFWEFFDKTIQVRLVKIQFKATTQKGSCCCYNLFSPPGCNKLTNNRTNFQQTKTEVS
jgi:hypothetical protein